MTLHDLTARLHDIPLVTVTGRVNAVNGLRFDVVGLDAAVGDRVVTAGGLHAEVVAVGEHGCVCMPFGDVRGLRRGETVRVDRQRGGLLAGFGLLGRVLDGLGRPLDDRGALQDCVPVPVVGSVPHPLHRQRIDTPLSLGVRAWDTMAAAGKGQRVGIFAGSGVGKSTLLAMIARHTSADVNVVALVGERGREVRDFIEDELGPEGMKRSVVIAATSDQPALVRLRAAYTATAIASWFRDQSLDVVLMVDSLTRVCMAQREIGLSAGEPATTKGYPPSAFALLPGLLEQAGCSDRGSITGVYTVLVDGDDHNEPVADTTRSILDGHITLSRTLAHAGHYPAIDVLASVSRVARSVTTPQQQHITERARHLLASWERARDLIEIGAYQPGSSPDIDAAIAHRDPLDRFLRQSVDDHVPADQAWQQLADVVGGTGDGDHG